MGSPGKDGVILYGAKFCSSFSLSLHLSLLSICDIWEITFCLTIAKYLLMLPEGKTVREQTEKFHLPQYKNHEM